MYLLRVVDLPLADPNAKIPRVEFPAADGPELTLTLDTATPDAVFVQQAYVYLFLTSLPAAI